MPGGLSVFVFEGSHPCEAVLAALEWKQLEFRRVELVPVLHRAVVGAQFASGRVPAMRVGARRVQGTSSIFEVLDELAPGRPVLFPGGAGGVAVREAERWGAGDLQDSGRRLIWGHFRRCPEAVREWAASTEDATSRRLKRVLARPFAWVASTANAASPERIREDLEGLPGVLDRVDRLIADGVIGGAEPNAADFQILSTLGVWMVLADLRPAIRARPCGEASARLFPAYVSRPGVAGGVLPDEWLAPVRAITP